MKISQDEEETTTKQEAGIQGDEIRHAEQFLNDQDQPSFDYMMKIAKHHTAQAAEIIMGWAEQYNINWDPDKTLEETVHQIWQAMGESNSDQSFA